MSRERNYYSEEPSKSRRRLRWEPRRKRGAGLRELVITIVIAFVLVFGLVRPFIVEPFWIPSESMVPTLEVGDRLFVNKFVYRLWEPERGDIVVFDDVEGGDDELIKRVVAVPGDRIKVVNGVPRVNGKFQEEPYVKPQFPDGSVYGPERVPKGEVFVMGDNRGNSRDSRFIGPVPIEDIKGEAFLRFWPPSRIGTL
jgi:signal peptidase I